MNYINLIFKLIKHNAGGFVRFFYIFYLRSCGVKIGKNCMISLGAKIDVRRGSIIIGDNCTITHGVVVLSHDAAASILGKKVSEGITVIGNNVFIGVNSVVLPGKAIGEHSIVGAGSVVTSDVPNFSVAVGNPAKTIKSINEN